MATTTIYTCDVCGERIPASQRSRMKWGREPERRDPLDLCARCSDRVAEALKPARPTKAARAQTGPRATAAS